jgi:hypothetical protein
MHPLLYQLDLCYIANSNIAGSRFSPSSTIQLNSFSTWDTFAGVISTCTVSPVGPMVKLTVVGGVTGRLDGCFGSWLRTTSGFKGSNPTAFQTF